MVTFENPLTSFAHLERSFHSDEQEFLEADGLPDVTERVASFIKDKIRNSISTRFAVDFDEAEDRVIELIFNELLVDVGASYKQLKVKEVARRVFEKVDSSILAVAPKSDEDLSFESSVGLPAQIGNMIKLLKGAPFSLNIFSWGLIKAILFVQDKECMDSFRNALQRELLEACDKLSFHQISEAEETFLNIFIGNVLALIPFTDVENNTRFDIPQKIGSTWHLVTYECEVLPLTKAFFGGSIPALGFKPITHLGNAKRLLSFRGTAHPTANGALLALLSDVIPGDNVGGRIFAYAQPVIEEWLNRDANKVKIYGQSLGGSLSLQTLCHYPSKAKDLFIMRLLYRMIRLIKN